MGEDTETISIGEVSRGEDAGAALELPVVDVLTGRSFVTEKSGSGKSNSASVICEKLLDQPTGYIAKLREPSRLVRQDDDHWVIRGEARQDCCTSVRYRPHDCVRSNR